MGGDWNRRIDYDFKAKNLTANRGFLLFVRFLKSLGFDKVVKAHPEVKRSRRRYSTVELFTCLISMMVLGASVAFVLSPALLSAITATILLTPSGILDSARLEPLLPLP